MLKNQVAGVVQNKVTFINKKYTETKVKNESRQFQLNLIKLRKENTKQKKAAAHPC